MKSVIFFSALLFASLFTFSQSASEEISVCTNKTTVLVFPFPIKEVDRGSSDIIIRPFKRTTNLLRIKAAKKSFEPTNLSVVTGGGQLYSINVKYDEAPKTFIHPFPNNSTVSINQPAKFNDGDKLNDAEIEQYAREIAFLKPIARHPVSKKNRMVMRLSGIYIKHGVLFFSFAINNRTDIPYHLYFTRFYQKDRSQLKRSSNMEKEIEPLFVHFDNDSCIHKSKKTTLVVAFDQFTIADNKQFEVEIFEKNGDRHLTLNVSGKDILKARPMFDMNSQQ